MARTLRPLGRFRKGLPGDCFSANYIVDNYMIRAVHQIPQCLGPTGARIVTAYHAFHDVTGFEHGAVSSRFVGITWGPSLIFRIHRKPLAVHPSPG